MMGDADGSRDPPAPVAIRARAIAIASSLVVGLGAGAATWALGRTGGGHRNPIVDGGFVGVTVSAVCFVLWERRVEASRLRYRWRGLKSGDDLYPAWRDLRCRQRMTIWTLAAWWASDVVVAFMVFGWTRHWFRDDPDVGHLMAAVRGLAFAKLALSSAFAGLLLVSVARQLAWSCPRCGGRFAGRRKSWDVWVSLIPLAVFVPLVIVLFRFVPSEIGWLLVLFAPNTLFPTVGICLGTCGTILSIRRYRNNYARRHGDPHWRQRVGQCVHCGLDAWAPSLPTRSEPG